jgi:hypothetical protein
MTIDDIIPFYVKGKTLYLPRRARMTYCNIYGLECFDSLCYEHFAENLRQGKFRNGKCETPEMIIGIRGKEIFSIKFNIKGYVTFMG